MKSITSAADLMHRDLVTLDIRDTLQDAMQKLAEHHISGVPVVDAHDRCVGVLSVSDILDLMESAQEESEGLDGRARTWFNPDSMRWEEVALFPKALEDYAATPLEEVMTRDPVTVPLDADLVTVAQRMVEYGIHRVFVVDGQQRLFGVISAFDFVRLKAGE